MEYCNCITLNITVNTIIQQIWFKNKLKYLFSDASFSENFYGLKRILSNGKELTKHEKELSIIFLVAIPYFKRKIEDKLQLYRIENAEGYLRNVRYNLNGFIYIQ